MFRVYISSTYADLKEYRKVAVETVDTLFNCNARAMEKYMAADERPVTFCLNDLRTCDVYVGIFAWCYGFVPPTENPGKISITEMEFREAQRLGIPCLIFLSEGDDAKWPNPDPEDKKRISVLRDWLNLNLIRAKFDSPDKLGMEIGLAITNWKEAPDISRYLTALSKELAKLPDLPCKTRNLELGALIRPSVVFRAPPHKPTESSTTEAPKPIAATDAVAVERAWLLVGDGGQGKSTTLQLMALHFAERWLEAWRARKTTQQTEELIPVLFSLRGWKTSIDKKVRDALQLGQHCSQELVDSWLHTQSFLFLVDRLDETNSAEELDELRILLRKAPKSRMVVATRPSREIERSGWAQANLQELTEVQIHILVERVVGPVRRQQIVKMLEEYDALDMFRRPLFAHFVALSSPELTQAGQLTLGQLFRNVVERRFLAQWEKPKVGWDEAMDERNAAAAVAHEMARRRVYNLRIDVAEEKIRLALPRKVRRSTLTLPRELLVKLIRRGLLRECQGAVDFWHASLRDYFAAVWLEQHGSGFEVYYRSWDASWHECLALYYGLLTPAQKDRRLRQLMVGFWMMSVPLRMGPSERCSKRFFLLLKALIHAGSSNAELRRRFIRRLPQLTYFYIAESAAIYSYFCDLIGRMRIPEARTYLENARLDFAMRAFGLAHFDDDDAIVANIIAYLADCDESRTGWLFKERIKLGVMVLNSTDRRYSDALRAIFTGADLRAKSGLLCSLKWSLGVHPRDDKFPGLAQWVDEWRPLLVDLVLRGSDEVSDQALNILSAIYGGHSWEGVPGLTRQAFLDALHDPNEPIRLRALSLLGHRLKDFPRERWRLLDDSSLSVVEMILFRLWMDDRRALKIALWRVIRKHGGPELKRVAASLAERFLADEEYDDIPHPRYLALIMTASRFGHVDDMRRYSVLVLAFIKSRHAVNSLIVSFREDEWSLIRVDALRALSEILGGGAVQFIIEGLKSPHPAVRREATIIARDLPTEARPVVGPLIFSLVGDMDDLTVHQAWRALREFGYVDESTQGTPIYLGPSAGQSG